MKPTGPMDGDLLAALDEPEPIVIPEDLGRQAAMAVRRLANSFTVVAETGHKELIEGKIDERLKAALKPLHHKYRTATRRLHTTGFREAQTRAEHIRSLLHGVARCLETPSEPVPITVLARSAIEAAALIVHAQDPTLTDLQRCTRYAALTLAGYHSLNKALREVVTSSNEAAGLTLMRERITRAGMSIHYDRKGKQPLAVSNSAEPTRLERCNPAATDLTKAVVGKAIFYRMFSGLTHGSAGHLLLLQDWSDTDQGPIRLGQVIVALLGLADAVPAAYCAILDRVGLDCTLINKQADLLVGLLQRMADNLPEHVRITIPAERRLDRATKP